MSKVSNKNDKIKVYVFCVLKICVFIRTTCIPVYIEFTTAEKTLIRNLMKQERRKCDRNDCECMISSHTATIHRV